MANRKISALPTFTGDSAGSYIVMNTSGLTKSYKVTKEVFTNFAEPPIRGTLTLTPGSNNVSFTVPPNAAYSMVLYGNIPNGITVWSALVVLAEPNAPATGYQLAYNMGLNGPETLVLGAMPNQIYGINGEWQNDGLLWANSNVFSFQITNNSASSQVLNYSAVKVN